MHNRAEWHCLAPPLATQHIQSVCISLHRVCEGILQSEMQRSEALLAWAAVLILLPEAAVHFFRVGRTRQGTLGGLLGQG